MNNKSEPEHFLVTPNAAPFLERMLFAARPAVLAVLTILTLVFAFCERGFGFK